MSADKFDAKLFTCLVKPLVSEKSTRLTQDHSQLTFIVRSDATKLEIKLAVEKILGLTVSSVSLLNQKGKVKRRGQIIGRRSTVRKAYVSVLNADALDISDVGAINATR